MSFGVPLPVQLGMLLLNHPRIPRLTTTPAARHPHASADPKEKQFQEAVCCSCPTLSQLQVKPANSALRHWALAPWGMELGCRVEACHARQTEPEGVAHDEVQLLSFGLLGPPGPEILRPWRSERPRRSSAHQTRSHRSQTLLALGFGGWGCQVSIPCRCTIF